MATEAEGRKVLHAIYEIRRNENRPDEDELNKMEHAMSMIYFLSKDYMKCKDFAHGLMDKPEVSQECKDQLKTLIEYMQRG